MAKEKADVVVTELSLSQPGNVVDSQAEQPIARMPIRVTYSQEELARKKRQAYLSFCPNDNEPTVTGLQLVLPVFLQEQRLQGNTVLFVGDGNADGLKGASRIAFFITPAFLNSPARIKELEWAIGNYQWLQRVDVLRSADLLLNLSDSEKAEFAVNMDAVIRPANGSPNSFSDLLFGQLLPTVGASVQNIRIKDLKNQDILRELNALMED